MSVTLCFSLLLEARILSILAERTQIWNNLPYTVSELFLPQSGDAGAPVQAAWHERTFFTLPTPPSKTQRVGRRRQSEIVP